MSHEQQAALGCHRAMFTFVQPGPPQQRIQRLGQDGGAQPQIVSGRAACIRNQCQLWDEDFQCCLDRSEALAYTMKYRQAAEDAVNQPIQQIQTGPVVAGDGPMVPKG